MIVVVDQLVGYKRTLFLPMWCPVGLLGLAVTVSVSFCNLGLICNHHKWTLSVVDSQHTI